MNARPTMPPPQGGSPTPLLTGAAGLDISAIPDADEDDAGGFVGAPCRATNCQHLGGNACKILQAGDIVPLASGICQEFVAVDTAGLGAPPTEMPMTPPPLDMAMGGGMPMEMGGAPTPPPMPMGGGTPPPLDPEMFRALMNQGGGGMPRM